MTAEDFLIKVSEDPDFENKFNLKFENINQSSLNIVESIE